MMDNHYVRILRQKYLEMNWSFDRDSIYKNFETKIFRNILEFLGEIQDSFINIVVVKVKIDNTIRSEN